MVSPASKLPSAPGFGVADFISEIAGVWVRLVTTGESIFSTGIAVSLGVSAVTETMFSTRPLSIAA